VHCGASGARNVITLFFLLVWDQYEFDNKCTGTRYAKHVFFNLVESAGHVVHSGASLVRNADALIVMLGWSECGFHKKHVGRCYAKLMFLHPVGSTGHVSHYGASGHKISEHYFSCLGGLDAVSIKSVSGHVTLNLYFCIRWDLQVT
jgi:hypothetical protein